MDTDLYEGDLLYTPVVKKWYYEVVITDIAVGGESLNLDCKKVSCYMSEINSFWTIDFSNIIFLGYTFFFSAGLWKVKLGWLKTFSEFEAKSELNTDSHVQCTPSTHHANFIFFVLILSLSTTMTRQ